MISTKLDRPADVLATSWLPVHRLPAHACSPAPCSARAVPADVLATRWLSARRHYHGRLVPCQLTCSPPASFLLAGTTLVPPAGTVPQLVFFFSVANCGSGGFWDY